MKRKSVKVIIMALGMCVLAACGTKQKTDRGAEPVTLTEVTTGTAAEVDDGDYIADDTDVPAAWAFTDEGFNLPAEGESEEEINWEWLYGKLAPGTYRITKVLMDSDRNDPSVCVPAYPLTAQFIIAGE